MFQYIGAKIQSDKMTTEFYLQHEMVDFIQ